MSTGESSERLTENKKKYEKVGMIINRIKNEQIIIRGDMNAHTERCDLKIGNMTILEGKITWRTPSGTDISAIDYSIFNQVGRERISKMKVDEENEIDIKSDHNVIRFMVCE